jgi:hypothetical protein
MPSQPTGAVRGKVAGAELLPAALRLPSALVAIVLVLGATVLAGCWGDDDSDGNASTAGGTINVAIVDTPHMRDLARLTSPLFTAKTHIRVNYTILERARCARSPRATWPRAAAGSMS